MRNSIWIVFYCTLFFDEKFLLKTKPQFVIQGIVERNIDFITAPDASSFFTPEKNNWYLDFISTYFVERLVQNCLIVLWFKVV